MILFRVSKMGADRYVCLSTGRVIIWGDAIHNLRRRMKLKNVPNLSQKQPFLKNSDFSSVFFLFLHTLDSESRAWFFASRGENTP